MDTYGVVIWLCGAVRSFGVPRAQGAHITLAIASISRKPTAFYITRDAVALYHDGNAVYITPPQVDRKGAYYGKNFTRACN